MNPISGEIARVQGFVAGQIERPFELVPIAEVGPEEASQEIVRLVRDINERIGKEESFTGLRSWGLGQFARLLSGRILGLYCPDYLGQGRERLLLLPDNIISVANQLGVDQNHFATWVLSHEMVHIAQFSSPALSEAILGQVEGVLGEGGNSAELRATMTWAEGSADFLMDRPGLLEKETIVEMRSQMDARRNQWSFFNLLVKLLGNKNGQYLDGYQFADAVTEKLGTAAIAGPLDNPDLLPRAEEIDNPDLWVTRFRDHRPTESR